MINPKWINLHYENKSGHVFVDNKKTGNFLVDEIGSIYIDSIKTSIGTYYKYSVKDLAEVYHTLNFSLGYL